MAIEGQSQNIFYAVGVILMISAVLFFTFEFLLNLSKEVKVIILAALFLGFLLLSRYLKEAGK